MATRQIALGTVLSLDHDANAAFDSQTLVVQITPPPRVREEIDGKVLGDTFDVPELGIEQTSKMEFMQFWHPGDTEHEKLDTLFDSKNARPFRIVTPHSTPKTQEFSAKVVGLEPETLEQGSLYKRKVTLLRTTAITLT